MGIDPDGTATDPPATINPDTYYYDGTSQPTTTATDSPTDYAVTATDSPTVSTTNKSTLRPTAAATVKPTAAADAVETQVETQTEAETTNDIEVVDTTIEVVDTQIDSEAVVEKKEKKGPKTSQKVLSQSNLESSASSHELKIFP